MQEPKWTHYAWLGVCPLRLAYSNTDEVIVEARHWIFEPLWYLSITVFLVAALPIAILRGGIMPSAPFLVTGTIQ